MQDFTQHYHLLRSMGSQTLFLRFVTEYVTALILSLERPLRM